MARFILRRLLWLVPTVILVTFLVFVAVRFGWDPVASYRRINPRATAEKQAQYIEANGLYPGFRGIVRGYVEWLWRFVRGPQHWSRNLKGGEVYPLLRYSIFNTLRLAGIASILGMGIGISLGILASRRPGGVLDSVINSIAFVLAAVPPFVSAVLLQLVFAVSLGWLPATGVYPPGHRGFDLWLMIKHLILPVTVVIIQVVAQYTRYTRASVLEVASADYLRTARAKGIPERQVLFKHSVRNALIPIVTLIGVDLGATLGGLIITENIFGYPGLGQFFVTAATEGDIPKLMPFLVIVVISVLLFNLLADLTYALLDPRIRLD